MPLSVDANAAYTPGRHRRVFEALDELDLVMIEQPLRPRGPGRARRLQARLRTPICLDESIRSAADAAAAIELGACRVINIKPGRVGGLLEARRVHDVARERGRPRVDRRHAGDGRRPGGQRGAWPRCPGVTMPGDTSASDRYFAGT